MRRVSYSVISLVLLFAATAGHAHIDNQNPRIWVSYVSSPTFNGATGVVLPERFAVKVVDRQGHPIPDITVWFSPNRMLYPQSSTSPTIDRYGEFLSNPADSAKVLTGSDGVAVAPAYRVGWGGYDVYAGIYSLGSSRNAQVVGWPPVFAYFHINQMIVEPPAIPLPVGAIEPTVLPASSRWAVLMLVAGLLGSGMLFLRRNRSRI